MKKIGITQISSKKYGGVLYSHQVKDALSAEFDVDLVDLEAQKTKIRYLKIFESFLYSFKLNERRDLWIRDFYSTVALSKKRTPGKNIALIFHIDFWAFSFVPGLFLSLIEKLFFYRQLKKVDAIVTISSYWQDFFIRKDYKNVYKIYCGFNLEDFNISDSEIADFKKKHNLQDKPIVYIGNCQKAKGVVQAYEALKDLDVYLVTSGRPMVKIPALNFNSGYRDYLILLKASSVAVTMSTMKEGWCMTAHEAMLLSTPVVGSGIAGMRELLEGGGQVVCADFKMLKEKVNYLLDNGQQREKMGRRGREFARNFTMDKFKKDWLDIIKKIIG